jgi:hypothetical protein
VAHNGSKGHNLLWRRPSRTPVERLAMAPSSFIADLILFPFKPVEVLGLGSLLLVIVVMVHGVGLDWIVRRYHRKSELLFEKSGRPLMAAPFFAGTVFLLLMLHVLEICIWGLMLTKMGLIPSMRDAMYYSANTYTSLGYGSIQLPTAWRDLSPIISMSGLFTFAWTTGQLFEIVQSKHDLVKRLESVRMQAQLAAQNNLSGGRLTKDERQKLREEIEQKLQQLHDDERAELERFFQAPPPRS